MIKLHTALLAAALVSLAPAAHAADATVLQQWVTTAQAAVDTAVAKAGLPLEPGEFRVVSVRAKVAPDGTVLSTEPVGDAQAAEWALARVVQDMGALPALPADTLKARTVRFEILAGRATPVTLARR